MSGKQQKRTSRREFLKRSLAAGAGLALGTQARGEEYEEPALNLPVRYYQVAQVYGPGMPPTGEEGLHEEVLRTKPEHVGLVLGHVWNLGEPDGPYPIDSGDRIPGQAGNWVPKAHAIIRENIKPALEAAREAGVAVFHLAQSGYADKYPQYREIANDPELNPEVEEEYSRCVRPRTVEHMWSHEYGPRYPGPVWSTHPETFDIAKPVKPQPDEAVLLTGHQLNGLCRRQNIDTLIYAGFMADICLLDVPGALREMAGKFRYTCVALRDCTVAYEFEETHEQEWMTFAAIRRVEQDLGFSTLSNDFVEACQGTL